MEKTTSGLLSDNLSYDNFITIDVTATCTCQLNLV